MEASRRFGGVARLFGEPALDRLAHAHVTVVGVGGVGSWAVEALARSGVGALTLIDLDHVAESNINRQLHALESTLGASKCDVMAQRVRDIAPACRVEIVDDFVTADNAADLVPARGVVLDAIDQPRAKAAMIALCHSRRQPIVVCGGAGGLVSALSLRQDDLARAQGDPLLAGVRARLRRDHGFAREAGRRFGVSALFFAGQRPSRRAADSGAKAPAGSAPGAPLACAGYGSLVTVTAPLGFAAAGLALDFALKSS